MAKKEAIEIDGAETVPFKTSVSWAGERFSYVAGEVVRLPHEVALAREEAGLGTIVAG